MKIFLGEFKIIDGEHEHCKQLMVRAKTQKEADEIFESQEHEPDFKSADEDLTWWDYGDGMTGSMFRGSSEISKEEALVLEKHNAVHFFDESYGKA